MKDNAGIRRASGIIGERWVGAEVHKQQVCIRERTCVHVSKDMSVSGSG